MDSETELDYLIGEGKPILPTELRISTPPKIDRGWRLVFGLVFIVAFIGTLIYVEGESLINELNELKR